MNRWPAGCFIRRHLTLRGCKCILDAGCGNGRYSQFLLRRADADTLITGFDLSQQMLIRARQRLRNERVGHVSADLTRLPYASASFDAIVSGWVLEHLPDPRLGLSELARVLCPGGKLLILTTENTILGRWCGRMWNCRTYNRHELWRVCAEYGLYWQRDLWFSPVHALLRLGGVIAELRRA